MEGRYARINIITITIIIIIKSLLASFKPE
jgi:hypothetical protein